MKIARENPSQFFLRRNSPTQIKVEQTNFKQISLIFNEKKISKFVPVFCGEFSSALPRYRVDGKCDEKEAFSHMPQMAKRFKRCH